MARIISSKHLEGVSDLTLSAPIRQGFIHAFESVTYETRLKLLLKSLFQIRQTARQYSELKPFVDPSEQIQSLLDFRLAVIEDGEPHRLLLTATFDRPFEPYMRLIWNPLGTLLDVIFCNCEGYVTASENSFEDYLDWVRRAQIDTDFFWAMSGNSIDDHQYVLKIDRLERLRGRGTEPAPRNALEERDRRDADAQRASVKVDPPGSNADLVRRGQRETANFLGLEALVGLYRLTDFYPPDDPNGDGELLRRAAAKLLQGWDFDEGDKAHALPPAYHHPLLIGEQIKWLRTPIPRTPRHAADAEGRPRPKRQAWLHFDHKAVQGGIARAYHCEPTRQGAMLLMRIKDAARARRFIAELGVASGDPDAPVPADGVYRSLAFTRHGLLNIGVPEAEYLRLPQEFREGMEERAGLLGDLRSEHPREWLLPRRNWPPRAGGWSEAHGRAELSEIDLVVQLRTPQDHSNDDPLGDPTHPLHAAIRAVAERPDSGVVLVSVEPMQRASNAADEFAPDHFGYRDGFSQPNPDPAAPAAARDKVAPGEIFLGHKTDRDELPAGESWLLDNGTFLAVRKLRQRVRDFHKWVAETAPKHGLDEDTLFGLLVGRKRDGTVLLRPGSPAEDNDFDYSADAEGTGCPFQAHIRRTNPRSDPAENFGRKTPRILRRGMSWGPRYVEGETQPADRGIMFMAYCGSLSEQFETIQRWINGGNSTSIGSWLSDPLMGAPQGEVRTFQFVVPATACGAPARTVTIEIDRPFVQLLWGAYLFVPSMAAIGAISRLEDNAAAARRAAEAKEAERGQGIVRRLLAMAKEGEAGRQAAAATWKACLEDFGSKDPAEKANAPAVWAAIRKKWGGVLRVPYPDSTRGGAVSDVVLVASKEKVMEVFQNPQGHYSMSGQMARMRQSFGEIFLGMDGGPDYDRAARINPIIYRVTEEEAFTAARGLALGWIAGALKNIQSGIALPRLEIDLRRHFITPVLGLVCNKWFDIPDAKEPGKGQFVELAGWQWTPVTERKPSCPGDYMATSRYCFYPDPAPAVQAYGQAQGKALFDAVLARFHHQHGTGFPPPGRIAHEMDKLYGDKPEMARTLIGVMTGFLPPTDGSLRWTLYEWLEEDLFWRVQRDYLAAEGSEHQRAAAAIAPPLKAAMQKRPSPDMLWRTAVTGHRIGEAEVRAGERILIGIVSAMAEDAVAGRSDVSPVFGGRRKADGDPEPGPLHACPAYKFAMGTMLGMLSALFDAAEAGGYDIRALPAPLLVELKRRQPPAAAPQAAPPPQAQA